MNPHRHYAAPSGKPETTRHGPFAIELPNDEAELFTMMLPKMFLRGTLLSLIATGLLLFGVAAQLIIMARGTSTRDVFVFGIGTLGVLHFVGAKFIRDGRISVALGALVLCVVTILAMAILAYFGAITLFQLMIFGLSFFNIIALALNLREVAMIGAATSHLKALQNRA